MKVFLLGAALAVGADTVSPETTRWFQATEQALMDAVAPGNSAAWERVMDPSCVVTTEEGRSCRVTGSSHSCAHCPLA